MVLHDHILFFTTDPDERRKKVQCEYSKNVFHFRAKMRGFPPWPGKICTPKPNLMKVAAKPKGQPSKWIFFFGSKN